MLLFFSILSFFLSILWSKNYDFFVDFIYYYVPLSTYIHAISYFKSSKNLSFFI